MGGPTSRPEVSGSAVRAGPGPRRVVAASAGLAPHHPLPGDGPAGPIFILRSGVAAAALPGFGAGAPCVAGHWFLACSLRLGELSTFLVVSGEEASIGVHAKNAKPQTGGARRAVRVYIFRLTGSVASVGRTVNVYCHWLCSERKPSAAAVSGGSGPGGPISGFWERRRPP